MNDKVDLSKVDLDTDDAPKPEFVQKAFRMRLTVLKRAQDFSRQGDIPKAVEGFSQYLNTLAAYHEVDEKSLSPALFDPEKDLTELLLVSNSYWELAKAYDRSPNLQGESIRCLKQFLEFTIGFKFQHVNAQMVRKFVRKKQAHNLKAFEQTLEKIRPESKGCYIATYCYGIDHPITNDLRIWRNMIQPYAAGRLFIRSYYAISPSFVKICQSIPIIAEPARNFIFRPILKAWTNFLRKFFF